MAKYEYWTTEDGLTLIEGWARDGLTDEQIAHNMGIGTSTLYEWKNKYKEITESLKKGKEVVDYQVENALLKKALEGDTTAMIFWLKNRRSDRWRDKQHIESKNETNMKVETQSDLSKLSVEELKELETILEKTSNSLPS